MVALKFRTTTTQMILKIKRLKIIGHINQLVLQVTRIRIQDKLKKFQVPKDLIQEPQNKTASPPPPEQATTLSTSM